MDEFMNEYGCPVLTENERKIIPMAMEAGKDFFALFAGTPAQLTDREIKAFTQVMLTEKNVPAAAYMIACYGLECLYWKHGAPVEGIPALLAKLEDVCGYKRFGMAAGYVRIAKRPGKR